MLNVSKNVSIEETERFKVALRNASWKLETADDRKSKQSGILCIFENLDVIRYVDGKRTVNFSAIFKTPNEKTDVETRPTERESESESTGNTPEITQAETRRNFNVKKQRRR